MAALPYSITKRLPVMGFSRWLSVFVWLIGLGTTTAFVHGLGLPLPKWTWGLGYWVEVVVIAAGAQALFTKLESPLWQWHLFSIRGWIGLILDVFTNINGTWVVLKGVANTGTAQAIAEIFGTKLEFSTGSPATVISVLILSAVLAAIPEIMWYLDHPHPVTRTAAAHP